MGETQAVCCYKLQQLLINLFTNTIAADGFDLYCLWDFDLLLFSVKCVHLIHDRNYRNFTIAGGVLDTMCASCSYFVIFELFFINVMNVYHLFNYFYLK